MPRTATYDRALVEDFLRTNELVATHRELQERGVPLSTVMSRIQPAGPWQRVLPGVVLAHGGPVSLRERRIAAIKYGGAGSILTGRDSLSLHGLHTRDPGRVQLLVPHTTQRTSHHFVTVERTRRMPVGTVIDRLRVAPVPRAIVDACRRDRPVDDVRALVAQAVQTRRCTPAELHKELTRAARQRTAVLRIAMREIDAGIRSVAEGDAKEAISRSGLPPMEWNVSLFTASGEFIGSPDGWYDDVAMALQIDSMQWHLSPALYKKTQRIQRAMTRHGIVVMPIAPADVSAAGSTFIPELTAFRLTATGRPRPDIVVKRLGDTG